MKYDPNIHHRKSIRLKNYDYSQAGFYFVTIVTQNRECLFGDIVGGEMILNNVGTMVKNQWIALTKRYPNIQLHENCVMPNHFHAILEIPVGATLVVAQNQVAQNQVAQNKILHSQSGQPQTGQPQPKTGQPQRKTGQPQGIAPTAVGDIVGAFKSIVTNEYIRGVKNNGWQRFDGKLWQRNYWEHIIRNENEYQRIARYIIDNPQKWDLDKLNGGAGNQIMETGRAYCK